MNEIITGPGDYKCRDGKKATVGYFNTVNSYWVGNLESGGLNQWPNSGRTFGNSLDSPHDIIAPWTKPKLRPWRIDEVPIGALVRSMEFHDSIHMIIGVFKPQAGGITVECGHSRYAVGALYQSYDHSTDGGKTWKPCGVVE